MTILIKQNFCSTSIKHSEFSKRICLSSGGAPHRLLEISAPSSQSSAIMKDLHPGTAYVLRVVAENAVGRGEPSDSAYFKTGEEGNRSQNHPYYVIPYIIWVVAKKRKG